MAGDGTGSSSRWRQLAWFVGLWAAGVAALTGVAMIIRAAIGTG